MVRLKEDSLNCREAKVGTALSADWMRPSRLFQSKGGGLVKSNFWGAGTGWAGTWFGWGWRKRSNLVLKSCDGGEKRAGIGGVWDKI
jgi:hypothetical protein